MSDADLIGPDIVLLLLAAPTRVREVQDRIAGITRLEKLLFLADKEADVQADVSSGRLEFIAYHYGPYSKAVYEAVELLEEAKLLREERMIGDRTLDEVEEVATDATEEGPVERRFFLTDNGKTVAGLLAKQYPDAVAKLSEVKDQYGKMSLRQLIRYVYTRFPDYAKESKIRDQVL
ncbi:MAG: SocA family protein [Actinobacteria bacterium]|nr:SocA family protein [Actinomycetota bacterium]